MKRTITATAEITIIVDNADEDIKIIENVETAEEVKGRWAKIIHGMLEDTSFFGDVKVNPAKVKSFASFFDDVRVNPAKVKSFEMED